MKHRPHTITRPPSNPCTIGYHPNAGPRLSVCSSCSPGPRNNTASDDAAAAARPTLVARSNDDLDSVINCCSVNCNLYHMVGSAGEGADFCLERI